MCSWLWSWRSAGSYFLDKNVYVPSCEHTFPMSCCCFSSLDKFLFILSSKVIFFLAILFSLLPNYSHHLSHPWMVEFDEKWLCLKASSNEKDAVILKSYSSSTVTAWDVGFISSSFVPGTLGVCVSISLLGSLQLWTALATCSSFTLCFSFRSTILCSHLCGIWSSSSCPISPVFQENLELNPGW